MSRSLLRSTSLFAVNTFLSRIFGFIRDMVLAYYFGADGTFDAFLVAFKIPNFMRRLFAEGAFSQAFVPVLSEYREKRSREEVHHFIHHMSGNLALILTLVTVVGVLITPLLLHLFAPGFSNHGQRFILAAKMLRITFPYLLLISISALCAAVLNCFDSFGIPSFTPVLLNITLIIMAVFVAPHVGVPVFAVAWGVLIAGVLQLLFLLFFLKRKHLLPHFYVNFKDPGVRRVLKLMVPALLGVSVAQLSLLLDTVFASFLKPGSISWLYFSSRLMNFPLGVFGVAIATVVLPKLSRQHTHGRQQHYSHTLDWGLRLMFLLGLPSTIGVTLLAGPLLTALFEGGQFTQTSVLMTRQSLIAFGLGIQAFMLIKVFASAFYARQDIRTPVKVAVIALIANMVLNAALIVPLAHAGLALATTLAAFLNVGLLYYYLRKRGLYQPEKGWGLYTVRLLLANAAMTIFLFFASGKMTLWLIHGKFWRITHLSYLIVIAGVIYFVCLWVSGLRIAHFREGYGNGYV